jgi:hypothetical protein
MWSEADGADLNRWRGSVEHISSGRKFYFTSVRDLNDFIELQLTSPAQKPTLRKEK